jgi:hypothetical protein
MTPSLGMILLATMSAVHNLMSLSSSDNVEIGDICIFVLLNSPNGFKFNLKIVKEDRIKFIKKKFKILSVHLGDKNKRL